MQLKHNQDAKSIRLYIKDWPSDLDMEELSKSLMEVSCNLQHLEQLVGLSLDALRFCKVTLSTGLIWHRAGAFMSMIITTLSDRIHDCSADAPSDCLVDIESRWPLQVFWPSRRSLQPLSPWILYMLSGASSLKHATLAAELLEGLPEFSALESLHIDARDTVAIWGISKALKRAGCHQLMSLAVTCHEEGEITELPELDLRHLVRLANCHLKFVPAPGQLFLPRGGLMLELTISPAQVLPWSKKWQMIRDRVQCISVGGYPDFSHHAQPAGLLTVWPPGIAEFHGLQFLQLFCDGMGECDGEPLDLAQLSYIPHVSLRGKDHLNVKIAKGSCSWKVLEIKGEGVFSVLVEDAKSFLRDIGVFYFKYPVMEYPEWSENLKKPWDLSHELKRAGEELNLPVHKYSDTSRLGDESLEPPMDVMSNRQRGCSIENNGFLSARLKFAAGSISSDQTCEGGFASWCSQPNASPSQR